MAKGRKKGNSGGNKTKPSSVKKTDGKESTSALGAEVVVEQPLVDKTGGETETETTSVVASSEIVPLSEEQKSVVESLNSRITTTSFPTNGEEDTGKGEKKVVTLPTSMCSENSQEDPSSEGKRNDSEVTTQDSEEVPPDQVSNITTLEAPEEKEATSSSADKAEIVAMPMESEEDLQREKERIVAKTVAIPIYTSEMIREIIDGSNEVKEDVEESSHTNLLERMRLRKNLSIVNSGFVSSDSMVAVSEDLFPFIARGYIHSEYCAIGKYKTAVHDIQSSHEASQKDFVERFDALSSDMLERFSVFVRT